MSPKRIATIVAGVGAIALLAAYSRGFLPTARDTINGSQPQGVRETADRTKEATPPIDEAAARDDKGADTSVETIPLPDSEIEELAARAPLAYERPESWFEKEFGRNYDDCRRKGLSIDVCKQQFEGRDQKWASETERRIDNLV